MIRKGFVIIALDGEAGGVDRGAASEGMEDVRRASRHYVLRTPSLASTGPGSSINRLVLRFRFWKGGGCTSMKDMGENDRVFV